MPDALRDLQGIWDYTVSKWSETQADKCHYEILDACRMIANNPAMGRRYNEVSESFLGRKVGRHVIFYTVVASGEILTRKDIAC